MSNHTIRKGRKGMRRVEEEKSHIRHLSFLAVQLSDSTLKGAGGLLSWPMFLEDRLDLVSQLLIGASETRHTKDVRKPTG